MDGTSGGRRPRPARLGWLGAMAAVLGVVVLAACGGGTTSASGDSSTAMEYQKALAYSECMRSHGVPSYPDPNSKGQFIVENGQNDPTANVSTTVANAAMKACKSLEPASLAQGPPTSGNAGKNSQGLKFSACMRGHGEPDFPDPAANGSFTLPAGMNAESPRFQSAEKACQSLMPNNPGGASAP